MIPVNFTLLHFQYTNRTRCLFSGPNHPSRRFHYRVLPFEPPKGWNQTCNKLPTSTRRVHLQSIPAIAIALGNFAPLYQYATPCARYSTRIEGNTGIRHRVPRSFVWRLLPYATSSHSLANIFQVFTRALLSLALAGVDKEGEGENGERHRLRLKRSFTDYF